MCDGGMRSILLLPLVDRCLETKNVCIWHMFVFMSVVVVVRLSVWSISVLYSRLEIAEFPDCVHRSVP